MYLECKGQNWPTVILGNSAFCFLENYRYNSVSKKKYNTAVENLSEMQGIDTGES